MKKSTLLLIISTALFFTSTLVLLYLNYLKPTSTSTPTTGIIPTDAPIPTVDPTSDWIIHENKEIGISYKYPSTWYLDGELLMDETCKKYPECLTLSFKSTTKSLQQLTSEITTGDVAVDNSDVKPVLITLGDNQVYEFRYGTALGLDSRTLYFTHENKHFLIEHFIPTDGSEKEINQILSTFKFLSPTLTPTKTVTLTKIKILDSSTWAEHSCGPISYKIPTEAYSVKCLQDNATSFNVVVTRDGSYVSTINIHIRQYDGASRRQYWIKEMGASDAELSKYVRFQESLFGNVSGLDVFASSGWWQGGYASPILIANGKTIVSVYGGRNFDDITGKTTRWDFTDTIASTIKFL